MRGLKGKRVLITGGASGIGAATAARFLEEGSRVCVLDRDAAACARIKAAHLAPENVERFRAETGSSGKIRSCHGPMWREPVQARLMWGQPPPAVQAAQKALVGTGL